MSQRFDVIAGLETGHSLWSLWDSHHCSGCNLLQYSQESRLAYRKNAQSRLHSLCHGICGLLLFTLLCCFFFITMIIIQLCLLGHLERISLNINHIGQYLKAYRQCSFSFFLSHIHVLLLFQCLSQNFESTTLYVSNCELQSKIRK